MLLRNRPAVRRLARGRPPINPDLRRAQILDAAVKVFTEVGYVNTTMELVANRSLISKATLYAVFQGKRELFAATVNAQSRLTIPEDTVSNLSVVEMIEAMLLPDPDDRGISARNEALHSLYLDVYRMPDLWEIFRTAIDAQGKRLAEWLIRQQSTRLVALEDAVSAARMLIDVSLGYPPFHLDAPENPGSRIVYVREFIMLICRGMESHRIVDRPRFDGAATDHSPR